MNSYVRKGIADLTPGDRVVIPRTGGGIGLFMFARNGELLGTTRIYYRTGPAQVAGGLCSFVVPTRRGVEVVS